MPGSMPATSQLEWLSSTTAMIVLFWSRATRDLLRSFGWGIAALHRENAATKLPCLAARPIASIGPRHERVGFCCGRRIAGPDGGGQKGLFLMRYRWFESISLQQTVRLSRDFSFLYRKPGSCRGVRGLG